MNGGLKGDEEGETVIDYVIEKEGTKKKVKKLVVEKKIESGHQPLVVWIKGERGRKEKEGGGKKKGGVGSGWWTKEGREEFKEWFGERVEVEGSVEEEWQELKKRVTGAIEKMGKRKDDGKKKS